MRVVNKTKSGIWWWLLWMLMHLFTGKITDRNENKNKIFCAALVFGLQDVDVCTEAVIVASWLQVCFCHQCWIMWSDTTGTPGSPVPIKTGKGLPGSKQRELQLIELPLFASLCFAVRATSSFSRPAVNCLLRKQVLVHCAVCCQAVWQRQTAPVQKHWFVLGRL